MALMVIFGMKRKTDIKKIASNDHDDQVKAKVRTSYDKKNRTIREKSGHHGRS